MSLWKINLGSLQYHKLWFFNPNLIWALLISLLSLLTKIVIIFYQFDILLRKSKLSFSKHPITKPENFILVSQIKSVIFIVQRLMRLNFTQWLIYKLLLALWKLCYGVNFCGLLCHFKQTLKLNFQIWLASRTRLCFGQNMLCDKQAQS